MKALVGCVGRPQLQALAGQFSRELGARNLGYRKTARALYELLVAPAEERLRGAKRICIVPDEELWRVPFQALIDRHGRYFLEHSAIFYAPSIAVLDEMMRHPQPMTFDSLLAVGNASIPETQAEVAALRATYPGSGNTVLPHARRATVESLMPR
ncbi:MAG TPA: CHAT domain-containing protein, partial [Thermoanaerobaculia bacterium]|nr:CHAT domain-containing protein [Thermoanaerobaculia bacterium]